MKRVPVLNSYIIKSSIVYAGAESLIFLIHEEEVHPSLRVGGRWIMPVVTEASMYWSIALVAGRESEYRQPLGGAGPGSIMMEQSWCGYLTSQS